MIITKKHLSRRTFLRGTFGTMVALPMLDAMVPALTAQSAVAGRVPMRFGAIYIPNGIFPETWHPEQAGADFEFKQVMKPMEAFRENVVTVSSLTAPAGSVHLGASAAFLNGVGPAGSRDNFGGDAFGKIESKKTVDQYIADAVAGDTPMRSVELGTEDMGTAAGACDGFPCTFFNTLSWRDDTSPLPVAINPRVTFERLFGEAGTTQDRLTRLRTKQSMLDSVLAETQRLQRTLGPADNAILDSYLTNVREVEQQLDRMESRQAAVVDGADAPIGIPDTFDDHVKVSWDLMHVAFQADMTRVFSFLLGHEASTRSYAHIGVPEAHHSISHHANDPEKLDKYAKIALYHLVRMGEFLDKLKETPSAGGGTLFDTTLLYFGSGMSNGNAHDRNNPPALLVGGASGKMKGNRHIVMNKEPVANLLVGMAQAAGSEITTLGPSTGVISLA